MKQTCEAVKCLQIGVSVSLSPVAFPTGVLALLLSRSILRSLLTTARAVRLLKSGRGNGNGSGRGVRETSPFVCLALINVAPLFFFSFFFFCALFCNRPLFSTHFCCSLSHSVSLFCITCFLFGVLTLLLNLKSFLAFFYSCCCCANSLQFRFYPRTNCSRSSPRSLLSRLMLLQVLIVVVVIVAVIPAVCFCRFCCCYKIHELFLLPLPLPLPLLLLLFLLLLPLFYFTHIFLFCHFLLFHWPSGGVGGNYGAMNCVYVCVCV